jgi:hypothetical protein
MPHHPLHKVYEQHTDEGVLNVRSCAIYRASRLSVSQIQGAITNFHNQIRPCHPVGAPLAGAREGSHDLTSQILRCAQDDITLTILLVNIHNPSSIHTPSRLLA